MAKKTTTPTKESFEALLQRLEGLVERLEDGGLSLEESLTVFEEGKKLEKKCQDLLDKAQRRVEILMKDGGSVQAVPFEGGDADGDHDA